MEHLRKLLRWTRSLSYQARLLGSTAVVVLATLIQLLFPQLFSARPYLLFVTSIAICSLVFERMSGFYALFISLFVMTIIFGGAAFNVGVQTSETMSLFSFAMASLVIIILSEVIRKLVDTLDEANETKTMLIKEMRHRIRNYLQIISGEVDLEAAGAEHQETKASLERLSRRIAGVAHIIQTLSQPDKKGLFDAREFFEDLVGEIAASLVSNRNIAINCRSESIGIDHEIAESFGVIANELVINAVKYAFPGKRSGIVVVEFGRCPEGGGLRLIVSDDGVGCASKARKGTGLRLVSALARLRGGSVDIQDARPGCRVVVIMKPGPRSTAA